MEKFQILNGLKKKWIFSSNKENIENLKNSVASQNFTNSIPISFFI